MPGRFATPLRLEISQSDPARPARLALPLVWEEAFGGRIVVPAGFLTDLVSVPWWARWAISRLEGSTAAPAVVHDWLYCTHETTREEADRIFRDALAVAGAPAWKRWAMWGAVRAAGGRGWKSDGRWWRETLGAPMTTLIPTRGEIRGYFGERADPAHIEALARLAPELCRHYEMTRLRWVHFAGQMAAETDALSLMPMRENMNFTSARRIMEVYSFRLGVALQRDAGLRQLYRSREALARDLVRQPKRLADIVYGGREGTPWMQGSRYIGRGPTQITHRNNYAAIMAEILRQPGGAGCPDLVEQPEALEQPEWGVRSAFADWAIKGLDRWADLDNGDAVSAKLNTGSPHKVSITNGLARRRRWVAQAKGRWPVDVQTGPREDVISLDPARPVLRAGARGDAVRQLQERLSGLGYHAGRVDGIFGELTTRAVRRLQDEHDLRIDGVVGPRTWDVLEATAPIAPASRDAATASDAAQAGVSEVKGGRALEASGAALAVSVAAETASQAAADVSLWDQAMQMLAKATEAAGHLTALGLPVSPRVAALAVAGIAGVILIRWGRAQVAAGLAAWRLGLR